MFEGSEFTPYLMIDKLLRPNVPFVKRRVDHINRVRDCDIFSSDETNNLRTLNNSLNNINQHRPHVKGCYYENDEWISTDNHWRAKKNQAMIERPARNMWVARIFYKGTPHELGLFDNYEDAHQHYLDSKEGFIRSQIKKEWCDYLGIEYKQK